MSVHRSLAAVVALAAVVPAQWSLRNTGSWTPGVSVYDEARQVTVALLFGAPVNGIQPVGTWEWDGAVWLQNVTAGVPTAVVADAMVLVYDPIGRRVLGVDHEGPTSSGVELWQYTGSTWTLLPHNGTLPPTVPEIAAAFDRNRNRLVVQDQADTWEWDGAVWTLRATTTSPGRVDGARMAFDAQRGRCVLVGGQRWDPVLASLVYDTNTYEWDGSSWSVLPTATARRDHALTYDAARGRVVLYGGTRIIPNLMTVLGDFLEWDGTSWASQPAPLVGLQGLYQPSLACDLARGSTVAIGRVLIGPTFTAQTWELVRPQAATWMLFGSNCSGAGLDPRLSLRALAMPWIGHTADLELRGLAGAAGAVFALGSSDAQWNSAPLPMALAQFGLPGCTAWIDPAVLLVAPAAGGAAVVSLSVPNVAALAGITLFAQGIAAEPRANAGGLVLSDAARMTIGVQ
jgi:hypothetical protein